MQMYEDESSLPCCISSISIFRGFKFELSRCTCPIVQLTRRSSNDGTGTNIRENVGEVHRAFPVLAASAERRIYFLFSVRGWMMGNLMPDASPFRNCDAPGWRRFDSQQYFTVLFSLCCDLHDRSLVYVYVCICVYVRASVGWSWTEYIFETSF